MGGPVRVRARGRDPRRGRPRVPGAGVRPAADELHLVGQSQGSRRPQPVPGRLPRPGQHRDLRSLIAAARGWDARAGRRHGVDGALLSVDAPDRHRARQARSRLRRHGAEVRHPFRVDLDRDEPAGCRHRAVGRSGRLLLRRDADARRHRDPAQGALARRPAAAVRRDRLRPGGGRPLPHVPGAPRRVCSRLLRCVAVVGAPARPQPGGPADHVARRRAAAAADPRDHARRGRVPRRRTGSARSPAATSNSRASSTGADRSTTSTTSRPSPTPVCSAATPTGAARCGSR